MADVPRALGGLVLVMGLTLLIGGSASVSAEDQAAAAASRPLEAADVARLEPRKLKELQTRSQDRIEVTNRLEAVLLADLKLGAADEQRRRKLTLEGRVQQEDQRALVARLLTEVMQADTFWSTSDDEFVVIADRLTVIEPSTAKGQTALDQALDQLFAGKYETADTLLSLALADAPEREVIQYWKAVAAIALKQPDRAERRLEVLSRRNPRGSVDYAVPLQRLQGPLRQALIQLEQKVALRAREGVPLKQK